MATISKALLDLLTNPKTRKFAESLKHSDLPKGWADDPEIVDLAAKAWQEAGTESPFFKAWFGDYINDPDNASQVVTSAGLPQVVYHGVRPGGTMFDTFDMSRSRDIGAHFSGDRNVAEKFANGNWIGGFWIKDKKLENPIVHDVYLNARQLEETGDIYSNAGELENTLENLYGSGLIDRGVFDKLIGKAKKGDNLYYEMDETRNWGENRTVKSFWKDLNKEMQKKKNGAKGAYYKNDFEGGNDYSYTVFRPEQIKSVNNRGTFNPADPNIYRTLAPLGIGTAAMAAALLGDGSEAEAMPRPQYMIELLNQLKNGDFHSMDFGQLKGKQLRKAQKIDHSFTKGPVKLSAKNIEKFDDKRIGSDGLTPEEFVDGLNRSLFNTRNHAFPNKGGAKFYLPGEEHTWTGVVAPHDGFSGLVTGYKIKNKDAKKELQSLSEGRPSPSGHSPAGGSARPGRLTAVESEPKPVEETVPDAVSSVNKKVIPAALLAAVLGGDAARATAIEAALADPASREKAAAAGLPYDPPVEESAWSPADLLVAPVGAVGIPAKLLAMALDAPVTLGLDAGLSALGGLFGGGDRKKPGGW